MAEDFLPYHQTCMRGRSSETLHSWYTIHESAKCKPCHYMFAMACVWGAGEMCGELKPGGGMLALGIPSLLKSSPLQNIFPGEPITEIDLELLVLAKSPPEYI